MKKIDDDQWDEFHDAEIVDWKRVRSAIEHENELTNHRLTWMLTSQAFLFAAFALMFQASTKTDVDKSLLPFYKYVLAGISLTGILSAAYLSSGLAAAHKQHQLLEKWWADRITDDARHPPISGKPPQFFLPYYGFPFIFVLGWLVFTLVTLKDFLALYADRIGFVLLILVAVIAVFSLGWLAARRGMKSAEQNDGPKPPTTVS